MRLAIPFALVSAALTVNAFATGTAADRAFGAETDRIVLRHIGAIHGAPMPG